MFIFQIQDAQPSRITHPFVTPQPKTVEIGIFPIYYSPLQASRVYQSLQVGQINTLEGHACLTVY